MAPSVFGARGAMRSSGGDALFAAREGLRPWLSILSQMQFGLCDVWLDRTPGSGNQPTGGRAHLRVTRVSIPAGCPFAPEGENQNREPPRREARNARDGTIPGRIECA